MYPTIGRIVHYVMASNEERLLCAAIITGVYGSPDAENHKHDCKEPCAQVCLTVFRPDGVLQVSCVDFSEEPKNGCWSWPAKV